MKSFERGEEMIETLVETAPNIEILNSFLVTNKKIENCIKAICSISGGSDSDIVLDICVKLDTEKKVIYVFFDTGLETQATKKHLKYLENKYGIEIKIEKAVKPIPICCRQYGVPFLSKMVSEWVSRLQRHNFKWEDKPFEELLSEYPKCKAALKWWCNEWGENSKNNIARNIWLKEFLIEHPPTFKISNKCCHYAKKMVAKRFKDKGGFDLSIQGVRKAEGGARSSAYKNCFTPASDNSIDEYRPIFWYKQQTKKEYEQQYNIKHSDCYEVWGLPRTGCSGCPYARDFEYELEALEKYEPKLYKAVNKVFGESYEYTRKYNAFKADMCRNETIQKEV
jgi:3'-phosphoadenosine 5'-phosphosulfate sulfotransferase (PAPS reductase)/FAD synthetase